MHVWWRRNACARGHDGEENEENEVRCRRRSITGWRPEGFPLSRQREGARARNQPMGTRSLTRQLPPPLPPSPPPSLRSSTVVSPRPPTASLVSPAAPTEPRLNDACRRTQFQSVNVPLAGRTVARVASTLADQAVPKLDPSTERTQKPTREPLGPAKQYRINLCVVVVVPYDTHALAGSPTRTAEKGEKKPTVFSEKNHTTVFGRVAVFRAFA